MLYPSSNWVRVYPGSRAMLRGHMKPLWLLQTTEVSFQEQIFMLKCFLIHSYVFRRRGPVKLLKKSWRGLGLAYFSFSISQTLYHVPQCIWFYFRSTCERQEAHSHWESSTFTTSSQPHQDYQNKTHQYMCRTHRHSATGLWRPKYQI